MPSCSSGVYYYEMSDNIYGAPHPQYQIRSGKLAILCSCIQWNNRLFIINFSGYCDEFTDAHAEDLSKQNAALLRYWKSGSYELCFLIVFPFCISCIIFSDGSILLAVIEFFMSYSYFGPDRVECQRRIFEKCWVCSCLSSNHIEIRWIKEMVKFSSILNGPSGC